MTESTTTTLRFALLLTLAGGFMDSYTYISRGGVFANAQTGNVIFLGVKASEGEMRAALAHVWPILAFIVGVGLANFLKSERAKGVVKYPIRWAMVLQIAVLIAVGFVPQSVPNWTVTIPVAFVASIQIGLFRSVGSLNYIAIATTGNLLRFTESAYAWGVERKAASRTATLVYFGIVTAFGLGAVLGALSTRAIGGPAAWIPAALLALTFVLFYMDQRRGEI